VCPTCGEEAIPLGGEVFINPVTTTLLLWRQPTELKGFTAWHHPALLPSKQSEKNLQCLRK